MTPTFSEVGNKIAHLAKYIITSQEFNKLTAEYFAAGVKQVNLVNKNDFYNKLISFNRKITSQKTKYLGVQNKFNSLIRKSYNSFLVRICFTSNDKYQNIFFINQHLILYKLQEIKGLIMFLIVNQREYLILKLSHYIIFLGIKWD